MRTNPVTHMLCLTLAVILCLSAASAAYASSADEAVLDRIRTLPAFNFRVHENGLGIAALLPVYTAPSESAFRAGNGEASVNLTEKISESNYVDGWLLIRYQTEKGPFRVGYIQQKYLMDFKSTMPDVQFERIPLIAADTIYITDDPNYGSSYFGQLNPGDLFYALAKFTVTGNWWYIECTVNGQTARGFIDRNSAPFFLAERSGEEDVAEVYTLANLGYPSVSERGTTRIGQFKLKPGERKPVRQDPDPKATQLTSAYPDRTYICYDIGKAEGSGHIWYYIWCEEDSKWGWISSSNGTLAED